MIKSTRRAVMRLAAAAAVATGLGIGAAPANAADCPDGEANLTYSFWGSVNEKHDVEQAVANWNKMKPCIQVRPMHIPASGPTYVQKLTTMIASGTAPDIGYLGENQAFQWATEGKILDLSPYMGPNPKEEFVESAIYHAGKTLMGTGLATGVMLIYYNKDVFDAAGVSYPPADPDKAWTWDEFVANAKKLTKDRSGKHPDDPGFDPNNIDTYGVTLPSWWAGWYPFVVSNGGEFASADGKHLLLNSPEAVEALQRFKDLIYKDHVMPNPTQTSTLPTGDVLMQSRKVAMSMDGMWRVTDFAKLGIPWSVAVLPKFKKPVTMLLSTPKVIFSQTKHPKEAFEFYQYISDPAQVGLFKSGLWAPMEKSYFTDPAKLATWVTAKDGAYPPEAMDAIVKYTLVGVPEQAPVYRVRNIGPILDQAVTPNIQKMLNDPKFTAQQAMDAAVKTAEPLMQGNW
jgi:multiple sugar transport system substrate-binding protein